MDLESAPTSSQNPTNIFQHCFDLAERFADCIAKQTHDMERADFLEGLTPCILHFASGIQWNDAKNKIFEEITSKVESSSEDLDCDIIIMQFEERVNAIYEQINNADLQEKYKNLLASINSTIENSQDNSEIETILQNINYVDPITKLPIKEPLKNKVCGHIYDKESIMQLLQRSTKSKCPIAGCDASKYIKKSDLIPDCSLKRMLSEQSSENVQKKIKVIV